MNLVHSFIFRLFRRQANSRDSVHSVHSKFSLKTRLVLLSWLFHNITFTTYIRRSTATDLFAAQLAKRKENAMFYVGIFRVLVVCFFGPECERYNIFPSALSITVTLCLSIRYNRDSFVESVRQTDKRERD